MKLTDARVLITGGAGGIGRAIAAELLRCGASGFLVDRDAAGLAQAAAELDSVGGRASDMTGDLTAVADRTTMVAAAQTFQGGINVLINNAGLSPFRLLADQDEGQIGLTLAVNLLAPIQLTRQLLPHLRHQPEAHILNIASVFGHIGYPGYSVYSATKFGMRGFSEALRRELAGSAVRVHTLSPRATRTGINSAAAEHLNAELGVSMDSPTEVATAARRMLEHNITEAVIGWPEKLYARLNALLPQLVDGSLRRQLPIIQRHAHPHAEGNIP